MPAGSGADAALRLFSTDAGAARALSALAAVRVLELRRPVDAFCGFEAAADDVAFRTAAARALTADVWFCAPVAKENEAAATGGAALPKKRRNCTVGFAPPAPLRRGADCAAAARAPRGWRDAYPGDKLLGASRLI